MLRLSSACALVLLAAGLEGFAQLVPQGPRFQVNSFLPGDQEYTDIAVAPSGQFVVVWASQGQDGDSGGVFGRRFDSLGNPIGGEFQANSFTAGNQSRPRIAMDGSGGFMVVWEGLGQNGGGILGQRFDPSGARLGLELHVSDPASGNQSHPGISSDAGGDFIVTWLNQHFSPPPARGEIVARRFDAATQSLAPEFIVSTETVFSQYHDPAVDMDSAGRFVVVWSRHASINSYYALIYGRRFDAAGQPTGGEFVVSPRDPAFPWSNYESHLDMNPNGEFVVVWEQQGDGVPNKLLARSFDADGAPRTGEVLLDFGSGPGGIRWGPNVSMAGDGSFVATWNNPGVRAQRFSSSGSRAGSEAQVDTETSTFRVAPAIDRHSSGNLVIAWGFGDVYTRQYLSPCAPPGVAGLDLELVNGGMDLHMTWSDVDNASEYAIFEDTLPGGAFSAQAGIAATGSTGLTVAAGAGDTFYLVAGKGACGFGPLR